MNPMLQMLNKNVMNTAPQTNNPVQMLQQFNQFKQLMQGRNPEQMINELIKQGKMTPAQLEQLKQQAQEISRFLH